jgi:parallel beta-helix repeat protein
METKTTKKERKQFLKGVLVAALGIVIMICVPANATETTLVGTGDPGVDFPAVQNAVDNYDIVNLQGTFDFTGAPGSLMMTRDVVLRGQDDDAGMAKIIANNNSPAISIWNPGGTVEFDNLDIESAMLFIIHIGAIWGPPLDACKDLKVKNCKIVGTHPTPACIATFGSVMGTVYLEGNHIVGHWCAADWGAYVGSMSNCKWEVYSNTFVAIGLCLDLPASKGIRIENNHIEGPEILHCPATQGEIVVKNNTMIQSGHRVYMGSSDAFVMFASHQPGFSGGQITGNTIAMNPSEGEPLSWLIPVICLADFGVIPGWPGSGVHGVLVQDNTITGKADFGIVLAQGSSNNIIKGNNLENFTAVQFGLVGSAQIILGGGSNHNMLTENIIGPLGVGASAGITCFEGAFNNNFINNDYRQSGIPGIATSELPCVFLNWDTDNNLVFESGGFPQETDAKSQVLDLGTFYSQWTGYANRVIGHDADTYAQQEDMNPGIGQRKKDALEQLEGLSGQ